MITPLHSLTPIQKQYYLDETRFTITSAGRRSRKTLISKRKMYNRILTAINEGKRDQRYFHAAPTNQQAKAIFWKTALMDYKELIAGRPSHTELTIPLVGGFELKIAGLDKPERIEGQPWHGGHITEFGNIKNGAFANHIRPVFSDTHGFCMIDGVPEGKAGDYYRYALNFAGGFIPETKPLLGAYGNDGRESAFYSWWSSDVLDPAEMESAMNDLDEQTFDQEYKGSFIGNQGLAYYNFTESNIRPCKYQKGLQIHIGMDFNVNPMTCVLCHDINGVLYQFDEFYLRNSGTELLAKAIRKKYPHDIINVYPDATGKARSANSNVSNVQILMYKQFNFKIFCHRQNPAQRSRINSVNAMVKSISGDRRFFVDPQCKETIKDFHMVETNDDGSLDKSAESAGRVHISDALGYLISYLYPIGGREIPEGELYY